MIIQATDILPSQDFLKPNTIRFIFECIAAGVEADLPPTPIVREDASGKLIAIDGHNLIAVRAYLGQEIEVHVAHAATDGLPETSEANRTRNQELLDLFDKVLATREGVERQGVVTIKDLVMRHAELFIDQELTTKHSQLTGVVVAILKLHGTDKLVFQRRDGNTHIHPNQIGAFGGSIEAGEEPMQAMLRELGEETSLAIKEGELTFRFETLAQAHHGPERFFVFDAEIDTNHFAVFEGRGAEMYTLDELRHRSDTAMILDMLLLKYANVA